MKYYAMKRETLDSMLNVTWITIARFKTAKERNQYLEFHKDFSVPAGREEKKMIEIAVTRNFFVNDVAKLTP